MVSRVEDQKVHDDRIAELRKKVDESLQQNQTIVYGAFDHAVGQMKRLFPSVFIPFMELDLFKTVQERALVDNYGAPS